MKISEISFLLLLFLLCPLIGCSQTEKPNEKTQQTDSSITRSDSKNYLYYLHGRILEDLGVDKAVSERFGKYEYEKILKTFETANFKVISEARPRNTNVETYSNKLAKAIKEKIKSGISPKNITVVGASKGSLIAMLTSTKLSNKDIKFVLMGNCNDWILENYEIDLHGKILSIYEKSDTIGGNSCEKIRKVSKGISEFKEIQIDTKLDHGFLYKPLIEWIEPTISWANR